MAILFGIAFALVSISMFVFSQKDESSGVLVVMLMMILFILTTIIRTITCIKNKDWSHTFVGFGIMAFIIGYAIAFMDSMENKEYARLNNITVPLGIGILLVSIIVDFVIGRIEKRKQK